MYIIDQIYNLNTSKKKEIEKDQPDWQGLIQSLNLKCAKSNYKKDHWNLHTQRIANKYS